MLKISPIFPINLANPLYDVCSFVLLCANENVRRESEGKIVDFYYDELCRHYKAKNSKPNFTKEQVDLKKEHNNTPIYSIQAHEFYKVSFSQLIVQLILNFAVHALPLSKSSDQKEQEKCKALAERLRAGFEDALPVLEKYDMIKKFTSKK